MARIGYGKIGRSMPLSLGNCGSLGGDVEQAAVVKTLAERNPEHTFVLIGRNDGSVPTDVGLPSNVENPWVTWGPELRLRKRDDLSVCSNLTVEDHLTIQRIHNELTMPTITALDGIILWAGQHGTTNSPVPGIRNTDKLTKPHDWSAHYVAFLLHAVNRWRDVDPLNREEVWLNSDARNYLKMRDLKWPLRHPVLAQYTYDTNIKHERYGDGDGFNEWCCPRRRPSDGGIGPWNVDVVTPGTHTSEIWRSTTHNIYSRLELNGLVPGSPFGDLIKYNDTWDDRSHFGLFINETRRYVNERKARVTAMKEWVLPIEPAWLHGTWSDVSKRELGIDIRPAPWDQYFPRLHSSRCTFTTPASGTGWATAKPWEAFAAGTVCFFHPLYDDQNNVLGDASDELREWLRVKTPNELCTRVNYLNSQAGRSTWEWLVRAQREHFDRAVTELTYVKLIERRLGLAGKVTA